MEGTIDNVKVRIRAHNPSDVESGEFNSIAEAISFLSRIERRR